MQDDYRKRERALMLADMLLCAGSLPDDQPLKKHVLTCVEEAVHREAADDEVGAEDALVPALYLLNQHMLERVRAVDAAANGEGAES